MTVYETFTLFFLAMIIGTIVGLAYAMFLYWMKN